MLKPSVSFSQKKKNFIRRFVKTQKEFNFMLNSFCVFINLRTNASIFFYEKLTDGFKLKLYYH